MAVKHQSCRAFRLFVALQVMLSLSRAAKISCPILQCDDPLLNGPIEYDLCWKVEEVQPMRVIRSYDCDWYIGNEKSNLKEGVTSTCDFSVKSGEFAWINELTQDIVAGSSKATVQNSQFHRKKTEAFCNEAASLNQQLNNGRSCASSFQCLSGVCKNGKCAGLEIGANCWSHTDCAEGLFCEKSRSWPFTHSCAKLRTSYQLCNEDAECVAGSYCWYASAKNVRDDSSDQSSKQCLPYYSYSS